jgi:hypothetical protein
MTNHNKYRIACFWNDWPFGTDNTIVASAATLKGCLSEYKKFVKRCELMHVRPKHTIVYCDRNKIDVDLSAYTFNGENHVNRL